MLSFSTCWNSGRHIDGAKMLEEIAELGFRRVELSHGIRISLMEGILQRFEKGEVEFSSLHNFCPLPIEIMRASPDCYKFSSSKDRERERALRYTYQTIDFAVRLGAPFVVLHLGRTPQEDYTEKLLRMAEVGLSHSRAFRSTLQEAAHQRDGYAPSYLMRARDTLRRVTEYAARRGVKLGIESRRGFEEIPGESEMIRILEEFDMPTVGYWHDFGHVQVKHNLGLLDHKEWLTQVSARLIGCHLHDAAFPGYDHMVPFSGEVPYDDLLPMIPNETPMVFELSPRCTPEEIVASREKWIERFGE